MRRQAQLITILACEAFNRELALLLREINGEGAYRVDAVYLPERLHVDFQQMEAAMRAAFARLTGKKTVFLYGSSCHPDFSFVPRDKVWRLAERNCLHALSGRDTQENPRSFFLTHQNIARVLGRLCADGDSRQGRFREQLNKYCDDAVFLDTGAKAVNERELALFSDKSGLPVSVRYVGLDAFRQSVFRLVEQAARDGNGHLPTMSTTVGCTPRP